ncbi:hypothetical protein FRC00_004888 [Tulasnella sp. 408]|nr:hypothetical protein FRC00_004888 [Tulasnella sp. 408]
MASRAAPNTKNRRGGQRSATQPSPLPSPGRSSRGNANGARNPSGPTAKFPRSQPHQGEERDHTQYPSDFSMEDGNGGGPSNPYPSAPPDAGPKSDKNFRAKLEVALQKWPQYIIRLDDNTLIIRDVTNFFTYALPNPFDDIKGANWSLWIRNRKASRPNDPAPQTTIQERPPTASVPVPAIMAHRPPARPDLEAEVDGLRTELKETQGEVKIMKDVLWQWLGLDTAKPVSAGSGSSQIEPASGQKVAHGASQINQADGHGGIPEGRSSKPKTGAYGVEAPQRVLETAPPYNSRDHSFAAGQPANSQSYGSDFDANPGTAQSYPDGHAAPGGMAPHVFLIQDDGSPTHPLGASTSSGYQQSSAFAAGALHSSQYNFSISSPPPPTHTPPGNYFGTFGGPRPPTGFSYVPHMANPNTSNQGPQAHYPRYR